MFDRKCKPECFPVYLTVGEETYRIADQEHYDYLNSMAGKLYSDLLGYIHREGFDYYVSSHPQEHGCFATALRLDDWVMHHDYNSDR